ncbi:MAG: cytochrome B, partial [Bacteroidota bacterium]
MYDILVRSHSGLRWIVLILLLVAIVNALSGRTKGIYVKKDKMINLFAMVFIHVQVTLGLIMYFMSPRVNFVEGWMKSAQLRFFGMEHIAMMILAAVLLTIGRKKAEKESNPNNKHRK